MLLFANLIYYAVQQLFINPHEAICTFQQSGHLLTLEIHPSAASQATKTVKKTSHRHCGPITKLHCTLI